MSELKMYGIFYSADSRYHDYPQNHELVDVVYATESEIEQFVNIMNWRDEQYGNTYEYYEAEPFEVRRFDSSNYKFYCKSE